MKSFLKYTCATILGVFIAGIVFFTFGMGVLAALMSSEESTSSVEKNSILRIPLTTTLTERAATSDPISLLSDQEDKPIALDEALRALRLAKENKHVVGIYLEGGELSALPAEMQELRKGLEDFRKSGKWIVAYADQYSRGAYYLSSVADQVYLNPLGMLDWSGMASSPVFYKNLMEKLGVKMQIFKVGTYKSAVEPFINTEMSPANREQVQSYTGNIWKHMLTDVAASRKLAPEALDAAADSLIILADPQGTIQAGLVDKLCYLSEVKTALRKRVKLEKDDDELQFTTISDLLATDTEAKKAKDKVAVYYSDGEIVDEASSYSSEPQIVGQKVIKDLQKLRMDEDVKAVVLRVNSPGGSAYASEQIWHEVELLKAKKPVVVSMGGLAASGGYYISCGAHEILAEPTTITGSIGIFGMVPDVSGLLTQKIGLSFDVVKTNAMSDFGSMGRPFNADEARLMQAYVDKGYELFTGRVAKGRGISQDSVKVIAEGRVWTGEQALQIGLVDRMGSLQDAVSAAAKRAQLKKYSTAVYPDQEPWYVSMFSSAKDHYMEGRVRELLGGYYDTFTFVHHLREMNPVQARMPFDPGLK